jgi:Skp family chaperone for outer membrane proteins
VNSTTILRIGLIALMLTAATASALAQRRPAARPSPTPSTTSPTASAQPISGAKIAFIDTSAFGEDNGIIRFRDAVRSIQGEFKASDAELQTMQTRIDALKAEIATLTKAAVAAPESITAKQAEVDRLDRERNEKQLKLQKDIEQRYNTVATPISRQIGDALTKFADERGIALTIDLSKLLPAILTINPELDLTQQFIADYNSKYPATTTPPRN